MPCMEADQRYFLRFLTEYPIFFYLYRLRCQTMRATPKITRVQLKVTQKVDPVLLGIVSSEPDYKLSLSLNKKLKISLKNSDPIVCASDSVQEMIFSRFSDFSASPDLIYELTSNRCGNNFLLKKLKNIDYIFYIHNTEYEAIVDNIISQLKNTEYVTAVFKIEADSLRDKNLRYIIH